MAGFLYYFPAGDRKAISSVQDIPSEWSVAHTLRDAEIGYRECYKGPDGGVGRIISVIPTRGSGGEEAKCGYFPDQQDWCDAGDYWIGLEKDRRPTPEDLIRPMTCDGESFRLRDGNFWLVPYVYFDSTLPNTFQYVDGELQLAVDPEYQSLVDRTDAFRSDAENQKAPTYEELYLYCCDVIAVNYRIGHYEPTRPLLDLIGTEMLHPLLKIAMNWKAVMDQFEAQKKTEDTPSDTQDTSPGEQDGSPITDQLTPTPLG